MTERGTEFAHIVYTLLVVEKVRSVEDVARDMGVSYAVLHARLIARSAFSAEEIRALIKAVPDLRLISYLLEGTGFVAAERPAIDSRDDSEALSLQRGATKVVIEAASVLELVDAAIAGGGLDHRHRRLLKQNITATESALASLRLSCFSDDRQMLEKP